MNPPGFKRWDLPPHGECLPLEPQHGGTIPQWVPLRGSKPLLRPLSPLLPPLLQANSHSQVFYESSKMLSRLITKALSSRPSIILVFEVESAGGRVKMGWAHSSDLTSVKGLQYCFWPGHTSQQVVTAHQAQEKNPAFSTSSQPAEVELGLALQLLLTMQLG